MERQTPNTRQSWARPSFFLLLSVLETTIMCANQPPVHGLASRNRALLPVTGECPSSLKEKMMSAVILACIVTGYVISIPVRRTLRKLGIID